MFHIFPLGEMEANCYLIGDDISNEIVVIDPGLHPRPVIDFIKEKSLVIKYIVNTHGHIDHMGGNRETIEYSQAPLCIHPLDRPFLTDPTKNLSLLLGAPVTSPPASILLEESDQLHVSNITLDIIHTPGHTPGSICLKTDKYILTGDTLFKESIGRTDIPEGSTEKLIKSIKEKLLSLDKNLVIYPGHGPPSSIKDEIELNPFLNISRE